MGAAVFALNVAVTVAHSVQYVSRGIGALATRRGVGSCCQPPAADQKTAAARCVTRSLRRDVGELGAWRHAERQDGDPTRLTCLHVLLYNRPCHAGTVMTHGSLCGAHACVCA